ncbi:MAG: prolipoprotein diacylglyceryl transferase [Anaerolineales bacterium]|nr:MAG: prolipoprotein diacylglyceryl transferase [Anaerolineales bacterium]
MINPVIFTIRLFGYEFPVYWYGLIVMTGVLVGSMIVERSLKRRGEDSEKFWDALIWVVLFGILGARLWYIVNATLGGNRTFIENPAQIINLRQGGLHIFGGFLIGGIVLLWFIRKNKLDPWLYLDMAGPGLLIGQAIGRLGNFVNQELYGPPTTLPWGIHIAAENRLPQFQGFPESTRFHPTFAYEMLWNFAAAGLLLWLSRRYEKELKPGTLFAGWLILAGIGRTWIEFFRPDQPKIPELGISYSAVFASLMAVTGAVILMARYKGISFSFTENWEEEYKITPPLVPVVSQPVVDEPVIARPKRKTATRKPKAKLSPRKTGKTSKRTKKSTS